MSKHKQEKESKKQDAQQAITLSVNKPEDANIEFIDRIQANWNHEAVILTLIQQNMGGVPPKSLDDESLGGRLVAQAALTWPHVVRLRDMLTRAIDENKDKVLKETLKAFKEGDFDEK